MIVSATRCKILTSQVYNFENPAEGNTKKIRKKKSSHLLILQYADVAVETLQAAEASPAHQSRNAQRQKRSRRRPNRKRIALNKNSLKYWKARGGSRPDVNENC